MEYYLPKAIYLILCISCFCIGIARWRDFETTIRILVVVIGIALTGEIVAFAAAKILRNDTLIHSITDILEACSICLYYTYQLPWLNKRKAGIKLIIFLFVLGLLDIAFIEGVTEADNYFICLAGAVIILLSMVSILIAVLRPKLYDKEQTYQFWISAILIVCWLAMLLYWGLNDYLYKEYPYHRWFINNLLLLVCCAENIAFAIILYRYPKKKIHARS